METDRSDVSDKAERKEREKRGGKRRRGERGGWEVERNDISFLPSVFPAAGEEKLADEARDERRARHDGAPKVAESFLVFYANIFCLFLFQVSPDLQTCNYYLQK